jgi:arylsulfatase A-like enzyme
MEAAASEFAQIGSIFDVAPTVLALLGIPVGRDMDGDVMRSLLADDFLEGRPVRYVSTHTEPEWFDSRAKPAIASGDAPERIEQLRALGYLKE